MKKRRTILIIRRIIINNKKNHNKKKKNNKMNKKKRKKNNEKNKAKKNNNNKKNNNKNSRDRQLTCFCANKPSPDLRPFRMRSQSIPFRRKSESAWANEAKLGKKLVDLGVNMCSHRSKPFINFKK